MAETIRRLCRCGNPARDGRPTCGIVICLNNDAYERAMLAVAKGAPRKLRDRARG